ncbi:hypothetical protein C8J56DRAFT_792913, partial [Mycena floridula]
DILLRSSDGFLIGAHRCNMGRFSDGFPSAEAVTVTSLEEIVPLSETKVVLDLLLHFLHPHVLPTCADLEFTTLLPLAYAAEKYQVFSAMLICRVRLSEKSHYEAHIAEVLSYAVRHRYTDLVDLVVPSAVKMPLADVEKLLEDDLRSFKAWVSPS